MAAKFGRGIGFSMKNSFTFTKGQHIAYQQVNFQIRITI